MRKQIRGVHRWVLGAGFALLAATSVWATCGDGTLDIGEDCDQGSANGALTSCCTVGCTFVTSGTVCRPAVAGGCDIAETCSGSSGTCPTDSVMPAFTTCRPSAGACDVAESCNGTSNACPADGKVAVNTICRPANGGCDHIERCDGVTNNCPVDTLEPAGTVCRPSTAACDPQEICDGTDNVCPVDIDYPDPDADGVCDAGPGPHDNCPNTPNPSQTDGDGDGIGTACDECTGPAEVVKAKLNIRHRQTPPGDDLIKIAGEMTVPTSPVVNTMNTGVRVILTDALGATIIDQFIAPGAYNVNAQYGWRANRNNTVFTWRNKNLLNPVFHGLNEVSVRLKPSQPGFVKVSLRGRNGAYPVTSASQLPLDAVLVLEGSLGQNGLCGEESFKNAPVGNPERCAFSANGTQVNCK